MVAIFGLAMASPLEAEEDPQLQKTLVSFRSRMETVRSELQQCTLSAEAAADRTIAHPEVLLNIPYKPQASFSRELLNRAGGLARILPSEWRKDQTTADDIVLFSVRSWETDAEQAQNLLAEYRANGWLVILFASSKGMPESIKVDYLIDNGAPSGEANEAPVNTLVNVTQGWIWCLEYYAALTRQGKYPPVLLSVVCAEGSNFDRPLMTAEGRLQLEECSTPVAQGSLGGIYIKRIEGLIDDLSSPARQAQVRRAADIISARLQAGKKVAVSVIGHFLEAELSTPHRSPWQPFPAGKGTFKNNLKEGDLLLWIAYMGMSSSGDEYPTEIRQTGADVITCYVPHTDLHPELPGWEYEANPKWFKDFPESLAHIDQHWFLGDAEVPIPGPPGAMAPISGIDSGLIYRMLDDAVAEKLAQPSEGSSE
jgi:hypothetical protein